MVLEAEMAETAETHFTDKVISERERCHDDDFLLTHGKQGFGGGNGGTRFSRTETVIDENATVRRSTTHVFTHELLVFVYFYLLLGARSEFLTSVKIGRLAEFWNLVKRGKDTKNLLLESETGLDRKDGGFGFVLIRILHFLGKNVYGIGTERLFVLC